MKKVVMISTLLFLLVESPAIAQTPMEFIRAALAYSEPVITGRADCPAGYAVSVAFYADIPAEHSRTGQPNRVHGRLCGKTQNTRTWQIEQL